MKDIILKSLTLFTLIFGFLCGCFALAFAGQLIYSIFDNKPLSESCFHMILSILGCSVGFAIYDKIE
ncbi:MAG: hypothetical protein IKU29_00550 [Parabacteroides sp.]|nr:hypothetical protein [Parabacteroides sp.]